VRYQRPSSIAWKGVCKSVGPLPSGGSGIPSKPVAGSREVNRCPEDQLAMRTGLLVGTSVDYRISEIG